MEKTMVEKYTIRTDLAMEQKERFESDHVEVSGVVLEEEYDEEREIKITTVRIETENGAKMMGKPVGTYLTLEVPDMASADDGYHREISETLAGFLEKYNTGLGDEYGELESDINECSLSVDEARQIAEEFLSKIGGSDAILQSESDLCWLYRNDGSSDQNLPTVVDGYSFEYIRSVMDQPVSDVAVWTADNLRQANGFVNVPIEKYTIQVDANGVIDALWNSYLEADGSPQAVELLSFDEMLKKANESIAAYYTKYPTAYKQIAFNDITLSYYLKQKEDGSGFEYVPAWIFAEYEDPADHELPEQVVILDARDGSALDLMKLAEAVGGISSATD